MTNPAQFEGEEVSGFTAQIPTTKIDELPEPLTRGTRIVINGTYRVKGVVLKDGPDGTTIRHHLLAFEEGAIGQITTPDEIRAAAAAALAAELELNQNFSVEEHP